MTRQTRRAFVATVGAIGLAGCSLKEFTPQPLNDDENSGRSGVAKGKSVSVADDFENVNHWQAVSGQGSVSKSTDDPYKGSQSARITGSKQTKEGHIVRSTGSTDLRGTNFSMAVKTTAHDFTKIAIELHAPDGKNVIQLKRTLLGPKDRWVRINFGVTGVAGNPDLSQVADFRILGRPLDPNASKPVDFFVDDLRTEHRAKRGAVMFTFDDSHATHYHAFELLKKYDFAGVEAVIPESIGDDDRLTEDQLSEMADGGWDLAAHPDVQSKFFSEYSADEQKDLLQSTQEYLQSHGFHDGARHLLVPKNVLGATTFDLARKYYDTIFSFGGCPNAMPLANEDAVISRIDGKNVEETKRFVDYAADYGQLVVPLFHEIGKGGDISESDFESLVKYVKKADVQVITASELLDS